MAFLFSPECCCDCYTLDSNTNPLFLRPVSWASFTVRDVTTEVRTLYNRTVAFYENNVLVSSSTTPVVDTDVSTVTEHSTGREEVGVLREDIIVTNTYEPLSREWSPPEARTDPEGVGNYSITLLSQKSIRKTVTAVRETKIAYLFDVSNVSRFGMELSPGVPYIQTSEMLCYGKRELLDNLLRAGCVASGYIIDHPLPSSSDEFDLRVIELHQSSKSVSQGVVFDVKDWLPIQDANTLCVYFTPRGVSGQFAGFRIQSLFLTFVETASFSFPRAAWPMEIGSVWTDYIEYAVNKETGERTWTTKQEFDGNDFFLEATWRGLYYYANPGDRREIVYELIDIDGVPKFTVRIEFLGADPSITPPSSYGIEWHSGLDDTSKVTISGFGVEDTVRTLSNSVGLPTGFYFWDNSFAVSLIGASVIHPLSARYPVRLKTRRAWHSSTYWQEFKFWRDDGSRIESEYISFRDPDLSEQGLRVRLRTLSDDIVLNKIFALQTDPLTSKAIARKPYVAENDDTTEPKCAEPIENIFSVPLDYELARTHVSDTIKFRFGTPGNFARLFDEPVFSSEENVLVKIQITNGVGVTYYGTMHGSANVAMIRMNAGDRPTYNFTFPVSDVKVDATLFVYRETPEGNLFAQLHLRARANVFGWTLLAGEYSNEFMYAPIDLQQNQFERFSDLPVLQWSRSDVVAEDLQWQEIGESELMEYSVTISPSE